MTKRPDFEESIGVRFDEGVSIPQGKVILDLHLETLSIADRVLSRDVHLSITGPTKVCIIGSNGVGKTTLLRHALVALRDRGVKYGYMPQDYSEMMDPEQNAIQFLTVTGTKEEHTKVRTYLGSMNFTAEEMHHRIIDLSGGQRAKLYFSKMILEKVEVLVMDEPTRNLSPLSGPEIRAALKEFGGCIVAVSHDRKLITEVFDRTLLLSRDGLREVSVAQWDEA